MAITIAQNVMPHEGLSLSIKGHHLKSSNILCLAPACHKRGQSRLQAGLLPSSEALCSVPSTLVALCLNTGGLARVRESLALSCFVPIFTSRTYLRALAGDTPSILGSGLDELMRHVPSLRTVGS